MLLEARFNLLDEPWIMVRRGARVEEVSLKNALHNAHEYHALAGELPTQDVAILRVLLAILYAIFTRVDIDGQESGLKNFDDAMNRWRSLQELARFPGKPMDEYFEAYRDRFWLFHPEAPFMQAAGIRTSNDRINPVSQIIAHVPSRPERRFFAELSGGAIQDLTFAQAARWLIHLQAWDYAGKKASVAGGSPNGGGTGWCGKLGIVYPVGATLFETLLLNLVFTDASGHIIAFKPPVWETEPKTAAKQNVTPESYVELLTWQSRRARLFCDEDKVTGVISSYGDVFNKENTFIEMMSGWHQSSQRGQGSIPNTHMASRSMWRDLGAILPQTGDANDSVKQAGVLKWLGLLSIRDKVNLSAVGYEYGAMQGIVTELISDSVTLNGQLFAGLGKDWAETIIDLLSDTEKGVSALGRLASNLDKAAGGDGTHFGDSPKEQAYFSLDNPFRSWLAGIDPDISPMLETRNQWKSTAKRIIARIGDGLIAEAGTAAFIGRNLDKNKKTNYMSSAIAEMKFKGALKSIFGGDVKNEQQHNDGSERS
jgi:CRISPR system Cascade subunit CasA